MELDREAWDYLRPCRLASYRSSPQACCSTSLRLVPGVVLTFVRRAEESTTTTKDAILVMQDERNAGEEGRKCKRLELSARKCFIDCRTRAGFKISDFTLALREKELPFRHQQSSSHWLLSQNLLANLLFLTLVPRASSFVDCRPR